MTPVDVQIGELDALIESLEVLNMRDLEDEGLMAEIESVCASYGVEIPMRAGRGGQKGWSPNQGNRYHAALLQCQAPLLVAKRGPYEDEGDDDCHAG